MCLTKADNTEILLTKVSALMTDQKAGQTDTVIDIDKNMAPAEEDAPGEKKMPLEKKASPSHVFGEMRHSPEQIKDLFRNGKYPLFLP